MSAEKTLKIDSSSYKADILKKNKKKIYLPDIKVSNNLRIVFKYYWSMGPQYEIWNHENNTFTRILPHCCIRYWISRYREAHLKEQK